MKTSNTTLTTTQFLLCPKCQSELDTNFCLSGSFKMKCEKHGEVYGYFQGKLINLSDEEDVWN